VINKNIATAIYSWPASRANSNQWFAVLTLRVSRYLLERGDGSIVLSREGSGRPALAGGGAFEMDMNPATESVVSTHSVIHSNYGSILLISERYVQ